MSIGERLKIAAARGNPIVRLPLADQCEALSIPLHKLSLSKIIEGWLVGGEIFAKPEPAAYAHLQTLGCLGLQGEGAGPLMVMKCAALEILAELNTFGSRSDACLRYFEAQCVIHVAQRARIVDHIRRATAEHVCKAFREVRSQPTFVTLYPSLEEEGIRAVWNSIGSARWAEIADAFFVDPYSFRAGWPDLTMVDSGRLRLVEIKTTDKLHSSQVRTFTDLLAPLGLGVEVLQLVGRGI